MALVFVSNMTAFYVHTTNEPLWRDAARRLHKSRLVDAVGDAQAEVFDGATLAKPQAIQAALEAKRHVLVAAEPCLSRDQIRSLNDVAFKNDVRFFLCNPDRYLASRQLIHKEAVRSLGKPELVRSHRWENHVAPAPMGLPGPLVAEIEQAIWLYRLPVLQVFAVRPVGFNAWQVHLRFDPPGMALIDYCDALQGTTAHGYRSLSLIGSRGATQIDDHTNTQLAYLGGDGPTGLPVGEGPRHLAALLDHAAESWTRATPLWNSPVEARDVVEVVEAVQKSLSTREPVFLEERRS